MAGTGAKRDVHSAARATITPASTRFSMARPFLVSPAYIIVPAWRRPTSGYRGGGVGRLTFPVTEFGRPFTLNGFGNWFADRCRKAGVPGRAPLLRKGVSARLAEEGATPHEIVAWTGLTTHSEVERYTRAAGKARRADAALGKLRRGRS